MHPQQPHTPSWDFNKKNREASSRGFHGPLAWGKASAFRRFARNTRVVLMTREPCLSQTAESGTRTDLSSIAEVHRPSWARVGSLRVTATWATPRRSPAGQSSPAYMSECRRITPGIRPRLNDFTSLPYFHISSPARRRYAYPAGSVSALIE